MEIATSQIDLSSAHKFKKSYTKEESLKVWTREGAVPKPKQVLAELDQIDLSDEAKTKLAESKSGAKSKGVEEIVFELSEEDKFKLELLKKFLEKIRGKKVTIDIAERIVIQVDKIVINNKDNSGGEDKRNWAVEYNYQETYHEEESMVFKAAGEVVTKDGRGIKFALDLKLHRDFSQQKSVRLTAGNKKLIDPLVINLDDKAVELSLDKMEFDLNSDGEKESLSMLESGSAFLALDKNEDGIVNNGGELFGPRTGNGFSELAQYDEDQNNWIDEGDAVFNELKLWTGTNDGDAEMSGLKEAGVGAIYLGAVDSAFTLKDDNNQTQGEIERSSIYLTENGEVKTVQKINLKA
ncbi:MAG: hypothetical protein ACQERJ_10455 [Bacillota bacterium]